MNPRRPPSAVRPDADGRRRQVTLRLLPLGVAEGIDNAFRDPLWADELVIQLRRLDGTVLHRVVYDLRFLLGIEESGELS